MKYEIISLVSTRKECPQEPVLRAKSFKKDESGNSHSRKTRKKVDEGNKESNLCLELKAFVASHSTVARRKFYVLYTFESL